MGLTETGVTSTAPVKKTFASFVSQCPLGKHFSITKRASGIKLLRQRKTNLLCFRMMVSPKKLS